MFSFSFFNNLDFNSKYFLLDESFDFFFFDFDSSFFFSFFSGFFIGCFILFFGFLSCCIENPIFSVLFLILTFLCSSILFFFLGFPFIGLLIIIIYVGAISVLFLYAVMLYKIRFFDIFRKGYFFFIFNSLKKLFIFFFILFFSFFFYFFFFNLNFNFYFDFISSTDFIYFFSFDKYIGNEPEFLGYFLFNDFFFYVIIISYILLVSMCGVILLTRLNKKSLKYSFYFSQNISPISLNQKYFSSTINLYYKK